MKVLLLLCLVKSFLALGATDPNTPFTRHWADRSWEDGVSTLAIQAAGRIKPLDTFSRETARLLTGGENFQNLSSIDFLLSLIFEPQLWQNQAFIEINHRPLKKDLGLSEDQKFFSPSDLMHRPRLMPLFGDLQNKLKNQEKLDPYFQAMQRLANQLSFLQDVVGGQALRLIPPKPEAAKKSDAWLGFQDFSDEVKLRFALMAASFTSPDVKVQSHFPEYVTRFRDLAEKENPQLYPSAKRLAWEVHLNQLKPFRMAWFIALIGIVSLSLNFFVSNRMLYLFGIGSFVLSFFFEVYGFGLRSWIAGRPPVSNMYESVIWVAFGCMLFGLILEGIYRQRVIALGAMIFSTIALIIADNVSGIMDGSIHPLEPVLRSNFWLTIHVLTITLGYAAFALSMVLGNLGLGQFVLLGRESVGLPVRQVAFFAYRAVQIGIILLAAGTILGGVWADYSWGRFWGWDPKETWALIALLGYLALIHARFRGMVGPFGFLAWGVMAFLGVLMAWYGVNFVLGAGLHSYGFSSGGVSYVATYCTIQILFVLYATWIWKKSKTA